MRSSRPQRFGFSSGKSAPVSVTAALVLSVVVLQFLSPACVHAKSHVAGAKKHTDKKPVNYHDMPEHELGTFAGNAHWYGKELHGRPTASGEIFDKDKLTAAHPGLPLGTHVRVKSLLTGKEVIVKVNDRCPHSVLRVIDLSEGAARAIGIWPNARANVHCTVLGKHPHDLASTVVAENEPESPNAHHQKNNSATKLGIIQKSPDTVAQTAVLNTSVPPRSIGGERDIARMKLPMLGAIDAPSQVSSPSVPRKLASAPAHSGDIDLSTVAKNAKKQIQHCLPATGQPKEEITEWQQASPVSPAEM